LRRRSSRAWSRRGRVGECNDPAPPRIRSASESEAALRSFLHPLFGGVAHPLGHAEGKMPRQRMVSAQPVPLATLLPWRDAYRHEMNCQVIHDSIHDRGGWSREYLLTDGGAAVGYGSVAVAGPWKDKPTAYEFYVVPSARGRVFELFEALLAAGGAVAIETQSNDGLLAVMIHTYARDVATESILFHDRLTTHLPPPGGAVFRAATRADRKQIPEDERGSDYVLDAGGTIVASGGLLWHYNRPYGDLYMHVAEPFRRRGFGAYVVQEIKRACYERGSVPGARCNPDNTGSRKTLQKAGFVPCGHILTGSVK
jgi:GNAT superfamily N-acetyltransferase